MTVDIKQLDTLFVDKVIPLDKISEDHLKIINKEGSLYHPTPQDLQVTAEAFVQLWLGNPAPMNESPIQHLYAKLINVYSLSEEEAYSLCSQWVKIRIFSLVAAV